MGRKARQDARSARRLLAAPAEREVAAYHVQQAAEKAIKAALSAHGIRYPRGGSAGHDLGVLSSLIPAADPLHGQATSLAELTPWATAFRYPVDDPLTAEPLPSEAEIRRSLDETEAFVETVARRVGRPAPAEDPAPRGPIDR